MKAAIASWVLLLGCTGSREPDPASSAQTIESAPEPPLEEPLPRSFASLDFFALGACWIRDDGRLICWGEDGSIGGALPGLEFGRARVVPGIHDVIQIDDGCAVTRAGEVHCFSELSGVWRHAPPPTSRALWMSSATEDELFTIMTGIESRKEPSYVVDAQGRLAWFMDEVVGIYRRDKWELVNGIEGIVELTVGSFVCVRTDAGTLHCLDRVTPPGHIARIDIAKPMRMQASHGFVFVLDVAGLVHRVALQDDTWQVQSTGVDDVVELVGACALRAGGVVTCGLEGEPWQVAAPPSRAVVAGSPICVLAESDGAVRCVERERAKPRRIASLSPARALTTVDTEGEWRTEARPCVLHESGEVRCMGERFGTLVETGLRGDAIAAAGDTVCASSSGQVSCWQSDRSDKIVQLPIDDAVGLDEFERLPCARRADDMRLCVEGHGQYAVLRSGPIRGIEHAVEVAVHTDFGGCALERSGSVRCWAKASWTPVEVVGIDDAIDIDSNFGSTCAVRSNGKVACWGALSFGMLPGTPTPVEVAGFEDVAQVSVGGTSLCARHHNGRVSCAGFIKYGVYEFPKPKRIEGIESAVHLVSDLMDDDVCALTGDVDSRELVCWGMRNGYFIVDPAEAAPGARGVDIDFGSKRCFDIPGPRGPKCLGVDTDIDHLLWPAPARPGGAMAAMAREETDHADEGDPSQGVSPTATSYPFEDPWGG